MNKTLSFKNITKHAADEQKHLDKGLLISNIKTQEGKILSSLCH